MSTEFADFCEVYFSDYPNNQVKAVYNPSTVQYDVTTVVPAPDSIVGGGEIRKQICWSSDYGTHDKCMKAHQNHAIGFDGCAYGYVEKHDPEGNVIAYHGFVDCP